jgi:hypothetical protein
VSRGGTQDDEPEQGERDGGQERGLERFGESGGDVEVDVVGQAGDLLGRGLGRRPVGHLAGRDARGLELGGDGVAQPVGEQGTEEGDPNRAPEGAEEGCPRSRHAEVLVVDGVLSGEHQNLHDHADAQTGDQQVEPGDPQ